MFISMVQRAGKILFNAMMEYPEHAYDVYMDLFLRIIYPGVEQ